MAQLTAAEKAKEEAKAARGAKKQTKKASAAAAAAAKEAGNADAANLLENMYHEGIAQFPASFGLLSHLLRYICYRRGQIRK